MLRALQELLKLATVDLFQVFHHLSATRRVVMLAQFPQHAALATSGLSLSAMPTVAAATTSLLVSAGNLVAVDTEMMDSPATGVCSTGTSRGATFLPHTPTSTHVLPARPGCTSQELYATETAAKLGFLTAVSVLVLLPQHLVHQPSPLW